MKLTDEFKFLKVESLRRKNYEELPAAEQYFYIVNLIDSENTPVRFFSFNVSGQLNGVLKSLVFESTI